MATGQVSFVSNTKHASEMTSSGSLCPVLSPLVPLVIIPRCANLLYSMIRKW